VKVAWLGVREQPCVVIGVHGEMVGVIRELLRGTADVQLSTISCFHSSLFSRSNFRMSSSHLVFDVLPLLHCIKSIVSVCALSRALSKFNVSHLSRTHEDTGLVVRPHLPSRAREVSACGRKAG